MTDTILNYASGTIMAKFYKSNKVLVSDISFSISPSESLSLIGETGSGKTIIAQSIMGVLPKNVCQIGGKTIFCGKQVRPGNQLRALLGVDIVYIPQNGHEFLNPSKKIKYHLYDGMKKLGIHVSKRREKACEKLELVGFSNPEEVLEKYPFQLSGGMAQRVTIALAACSRASLIIADEPTNGLDEVAKDYFMAQLNELFPKAAKLIITHDISVAWMTDRILVLCGGKKMETGRSDDVLCVPHHPYTKALIGALVSNGMRETPVLRTEDAFCPFYKRCQFGVPMCQEQMHYRINGTTKWWCSGI